MNTATGFGANLEAGMAKFVGRNWWVLLIRGLASIAFGILAFVSPGITIQTLVLFLAAWFVVDGVFGIIGAIQHRTADKQWWVMLLEGIVGVIAGVVAFVYPGPTLVVLLYFFGAWCVITGVLEIVAAIRLRKEIQGEFWLILGGLLSIVVGVFAFIAPGITALSLVTLMGAYAVVFGVLLIVLAFRARNWSKSTTTLSPQA